MYVCVCDVCVCVCVCVRVYVCVMYIMCVGVFIHSSRCFEAFTISCLSQPVCHLTKSRHEVLVMTFH